MIKIQLLVIIILSLNSNLLAYEQIPNDCSNVNYDQNLYKLSYRFTAQGFDYHTVYMGPKIWNTSNQIRMDFSSETYPGWLWGPYTLNPSRDYTDESIFLSPQTANFYLTVPDIVGVDYDLYLYKVDDNNNITEVSRSDAYYQADEHINYIVTNTTAGKYMLRVSC